MTQLDTKQRSPGSLYMPSTCRFLSRSVALGQLYQRTCGYRTCPQQVWQHCMWTLLARFRRLLSNRNLRMHTLACMRLGMACLYTTNSAQHGWRFSCPSCCNQAIPYKTVCRPRDLQQPYVSPEESASWPSLQLLPSNTRQQADPQTSRCTKRSPQHQHSCQACLIWNA